MTLLSSLLRLCQSSGATRIRTVGSSDSSCWVEASRGVPTTPTLASTLTSRYHQCISWCLFFFFSSTVLTLILSCGIFASLGTRNVYRDMLDNLVSPIDHVVMNHQNHTRTNGIWGHVHYMDLNKSFSFETCRHPLWGPSARRPRKVVQ
jgi:hypothetical protein